jgi:hypothetical protein
MHFRFVGVDCGKELLAVETDADTVVSYSGEGQLSNEDGSIGPACNYATTRCTRAGCAVAVPHVSFGSAKNSQISCVVSKSLPCGLVIGKSLRCMAIIVENFFRPSNGRSSILSPTKLSASRSFHRFGEHSKRGVPHAYGSGVRRPAESCSS